MRFLALGFTKNYQILTFRQLRCGGLCKMEPIDQIIMRIGKIGAPPNES